VTKVISQTFVTLVTPEGGALN